MVINRQLQPPRAENSSRIFLVHISSGQTINAECPSIYKTITAKIEKMR